MTVAFCSTAVLTLLVVSAFAADDKPETKMKIRDVLRFMTEVIDQVKQLGHEEKIFDDLVKTMDSLNRVGHLLDKHVETQAEEARKLVERVERVEEELSKQY